jgi:hypothetical protein
VAPTGTPATAPAASAAVWTPDPTIADMSGNTIAASGANLAQTSATRQL